MSLPATKTMQFIRVPSQEVTTDNDEQWVTFSDLLRIIRINWGRILLTGFIAGAIGVGAVLAMRPIYVGTALVMVVEFGQRNPW